jgi:hypothetical protein
MKHFILLAGLLVFSLGMAGAQQSRSLEVQGGDLYANGNRDDYLKYTQTIMDYAAEYEYYIQEIHVKDIAYLRAGNLDGYKNTFRVEEAVLPDDARVVSVFAQLKTMEVVHRFSNKPFKEPHVRKVIGNAEQGPVTRTLRSREANASIAQQQEAWNKYLDNVYKEAIAKLQTAKKTMGRAKSPLLDNLSRDIALLESHNKEHSLFYSKR